MAVLDKGGQRRFRRRVRRIARLGRGLVSPGYTIFRIVRDEVWPHL
jgi:hypothetical protein